MSATIAQLIEQFDSWYPPHRAADWDAVGLVCGRTERPVDTVLFAVDCVAATVTEAVDRGAGLLVTHHPLLLRPVSSVAPLHGYKGELLHTLIEAGIGLYVAHTNADVAHPGVSDALADLLGVTRLRPLSPIDDGPAGIGRVGELDEPMPLRDFVSRVVHRLPATAAGVRATGDPDRPVSTVAVSGGAGDGYLTHATAAGADVFVTADLRHHPAGEHDAAGGPALIDVAHWASEWPWLNRVAARTRAALPVDTVVSDLNTDPWTLHADAPR